MNYGQSIANLGKKLQQSNSNAAQLNNLLQEITELLPGNYWWKDCDGRYTGCNAQELDTLGFDCLDEVINLSDHDLPWYETAKCLVDNDQKVMENKLTQECIEEIFTKDGKNLIFKVVKVPLINCKNEVIGTLGHSVDVTELAKIASPFSTNMTASFFIEALTLRENECVYYLAHGYSSKQTGKKLNLSHRTIEDYLDKAKGKLHFCNKYDLVDYVNSEIRPYYLKKILS